MIECERPIALVRVVFLLCLGLLDLLQIQLNLLQFEGLVASHGFVSQVYDSLEGDIVVRRGRRAFEELHANLSSKSGSLFSRDFSHLFTTIIVVGSGLVANQDLLN